ncbi:MAG: DUF5103 domain-containing protein [Bacteroidota bacterium]|nr:DUF5103 domain-containing protein [Bacteroidota bacterium]
MRNLILLTLFLLHISNIQAQTENEIAPPFNIKTASFVYNNENVIPFFALGESFTFKFDDLYTSEQDYFYTITHCDYDWKPSNLTKSEYLLGFDNVRIQEYANSQNTLQSYSHYTLNIPNFQTKQIKLSGNYILKIFDSQGQLMLSRRFVMYENTVGVGVQVKRSRNISEVAHKHNLDFSIKPGNLLLQNPFENVKVVLLQNGIWHSAIKNIRPQYNIGTELIYKYDHETSFDASNEYLWFDTKDVRAANNSIYKITSGEIYMTHLYTNTPRANQIYTYFPDVNGNFVVSNVIRQNANLEADYTWVFFNLKVDKNTHKEDIYIGGMFNNYALTDEYKLDYSSKEGVYTKAVMVKQGFTNFQYFLVDKKGQLNTQEAIDGNFYQTENDYTVLVYYRGTTDLYDRVIGIGRANSENIVN